MARGHVEHLAQNAGHSCLLRLFTQGYLMLQAVAIFSLASVGVNSSKPVKGNPGHSLAIWRLTLVSINCFIYVAQQACRFKHKHV